MALPKLEVMKNIRSERQRNKAQARERAQSVHYLFLPGGQSLNGTLDLSDRITVNVRQVPQGRLVPVNSFFYPAPVLAHETTSRQLFDSGSINHEDDEVLNAVDSFMPAAVQVGELVDAYGNPDYGIGLVSVETLVGVPNAEEIYEPLLITRQHTNLIDLMADLESAYERIHRARSLDEDQKDLAMQVRQELLQACERRKRQIEMRCETAVNEVESARLGGINGGKKQLDAADHYWFRQLKMEPPKASLAQQAAAVASAQPQKVVMTEEFDESSHQQCPECKEYIRLGAVVCRWCRFRFPEDQDAGERGVMAGGIKEEDTPPAVDLEAIKAEEAQKTADELFAATTPVAPPAKTVDPGAVVTPNRFEKPKKENGK